MVPTWKRVGTFAVLEDEDGGVVRKIGGNVASYICTPEGQVVHYVAGPVHPDHLRAEIEWALDAWKDIEPRAASSLDVARSLLAGAHADRAARLRWRQRAAHDLLADRPLAPIAEIYPVVWERQLQEFVSDLPVQVVKSDCGLFYRVLHSRGARRVRAGEALHDALLVHALDHASDADIERRVDERLREAEVFRELCVRVALRDAETAISVRMRERLRTDAVFRELCLAPGDGAFARTVLLMFDAGPRSRHELAARLLDPAFREACAEVLSEERQAELAVLLIEGLARDRDRAPGNDPRLTALAALDPEAVGTAFANAFGSAREETAGEPPADIAAVLVDGAGALGDARIGAALASELVPLRWLVEVALERDDASLDRIAAAIAGSPRTVFGKIARKVEALDADVAAELALRLADRLETTSGSRRRELFRLFAAHADERGVGALVDALRWDGGRLMPEAIDALRRVTGVPFARPKRSRSARARQVVQIEWWWAEQRVARSVSAD